MECKDDLPPTATYLERSHHRLFVSTVLYFCVKLVIIYLESFCLISLRWTGIYQYEMWRKTLWRSLIWKTTAHSESLCNGLVKINLYILVHVVVTLYSINSTNKLYYNNGIGGKLTLLSTAWMLVPLFSDFVRKTNTLQILPLLIKWRNPAKKTFPLIVPPPPLGERLLPSLHSFSTEIVEKQKYWKKNWQSN